MNRFRSLSAAVALAVALTGCTSINTSDATTQFAVRYATMKFVEKGSEPAVRAAKVVEVARDAKQFLNGETVTLDMLTEAVRVRLDDADLSPADRLLADALVATVANELAIRVGRGELAADQQLVVNAVLDWIIDAASV